MPCRRIYVSFRSPGPYLPWLWVNDGPQRSVLSVPSCRPIVYSTRWSLQNVNQTGCLSLSSLEWNAQPSPWLIPPPVLPCPIHSSPQPLSPPSSSLPLAYTSSFLLLLQGVPPDLPLTPWGLCSQRATFSTPMSSPHYPSSSWGYLYLSGCEAFVQFLFSPRQYQSSWRAENCVVQCCICRT